MDINVSKSAVVSYHRTEQRIDFSYTMNNAILPRKSAIRDLGVLMSYDLNPDLHVNTICNKASKALGFVIRCGRYGLDVNALRTLYMTQVRPVLEYGSLIWNPHQINHISRVEKIQNRFLRSIGVKLGHEFYTVPIEDIRIDMCLPRLSDRRQSADLSFLWKLLNGEVDAPEILRLINFHVPRHFRHIQLFNKASFSTNYAFHSTIPRLHRLGNQACQHVDMFTCKLKAIKNILV
ncbi:uncharacterized protein LOC129003653 [Macrosteles quadrilineatus]|uniref:uncharacterized protein LOC129003653 n=1 Tax=Macrosteles quadrilineatus TaxID=74068 RepID=UPI0023E2F578|nr:uncharacterized protein LOC129003653 [Macrosteles quadrilineatus]